MLLLFDFVFFFFIFAEHKFVFIQNYSRAVSLIGYCFLFTTFCRKLFTSGFDYNI
nr:MAG TPA: hypothetical protein [Caudoviricetes sp.]